MHKQAHAQILKSFLFLLSIPLICVANVQKSNHKKGIAAKGYDVVAYFGTEDTSGKAIKGKVKITANHQGLKYYFSSIENKEKFEKDPDKYVPAYGGWCAWAMAEHKDLVDINPKSFLISTDVNGQKKLFLFYDGLFGDTRKQWLEKSNKQASESNTPGELELLKKADSNWITFQ